MTVCGFFRSALVGVAFVTVSVAVPVASGQSTPLSEAATASGGTIPQSGNCPAGRQRDEARQYGDELLSAHAE